MVDKHPWEVRLDARIARSERAKAVRKPPLHPLREGFCQFCDTSIPQRVKKDGQLYAIQPTWHSECGPLYRRMGTPKLFMRDLIERDGERCADCAAGPTGWRPDRWVDDQPAVSDWSRWDEGSRPDWYGGPFVAIHGTGGPPLAVDHVIPLWSVADIETVAKRQWYFGIENLQLLCMAKGGCHDRKTAGEAARRAKIKRL